VKIYTRSQVKKWPAPKWVIKKLLAEGTINYLLSEWGKGKSFVAIDWAVHIALGRDWQGFKTAKRRVLYVAAEGIPNKRLDAWEQHFGTDITDGLFLCPGMSLTNGDDVEELQKIIDEEDIGVVFFDTQHAVSRGVGENGADDAGEILGPLQELREEFPDLVSVMLHHRGKEPSRGGRGSSAFPAAMDYIYEIDSDDPKVSLTLKRTKQREEGTFGEMAFRLEVVKLGEDEDGDPVTSCVVIESDPVGDADMRTKFVLALQGHDAEWVGTKALMAMVSGKNDTKHRLIKEMTNDGTLTQRKTGNRVMYRLS
jgi:hypothetical protein